MVLGFGKKKEAKEIPKVVIREKESLETQKEKLEKELAELNKMEEEEKTETTQTSKKTRIQVVREIPTVPVRKYTDEKGVEVELITIEEALSEIMNRED